MQPTRGGRSGPPKTPVPAAWQPILDDFTEWLAAAGRPKSTIGTRLAHLRHLARELAVPPGEVTESALLKWFASQGHWSPETRRGYRASCVVFFRWAVKTGVAHANPTDELPTVKATVGAPRPAPDLVWKEAASKARPREALMLQLACEAGLRRAEVAQVHVDDLLDGIGGAQLLVHGKGDRERVIPITDELAGRIAAGPAGHTPELASLGTGWLFPGDDDGHLSPRWVGKLCAKELPGVWTMHALRHRFATKAYRGTRNLRAVQKLLGHSSVATTERYTAVDDDELREAMLAAVAPSTPRRWSNTA
ncbi:tyrosine-type recombinase/integrase [Mycobacteroides abscessus]|uniref:tyrosine-type recombinase/integrase n=1 Tax=Mycobacteroides abscessus TaxID=36809 RepID=UPI000AB5717E